MPVSDEEKAAYKQRLREMSDEKLRLDLDTGVIDLTWKRSLAEMELRRRGEEERATRFYAQESARLEAQEYQDAQMAKQLSLAEKQANSVKHATRAAWVAALAAIGLLGFTVFQFFGFRAPGRGRNPPVWVNKGCLPPDE